MKKLIPLSICMMLMFLFGCDRKKDEGPMMAVAFRNEVKTADVWIIPDTEANRKTTVWGTASIAKLPQNDEGEARIPVSENGLYLFRMIDDDHMYYEANGLALEEGWSLRLYDDGKICRLEILDVSGNVIETLEVFRARL